jgi:threonine synthase
MTAAYNLKMQEKVPVVVLSTAHPAKFPAAVEQATGQIPELPPRLKEALAGEEKCHRMRGEKALVRGFIEAKL